MKLISHPADGEIEEKPLYEHLSNVAHKSYNEIKKQSLKLSLIKKEKLQRLSFLVGLFHDFGKATTWFQNYVRNLANSSNLTKHSLFSAIVTYYAVKNEFKSDLWAYVAFQVVNRHHQNLTSFDVTEKIPEESSFCEKMENIVTNNFDKLKIFYRKFSINLDFIKNINLKNFTELMNDSDEILDDFIKNEDDRIELFFITNYLFSILIDLDKLDAARISNEYFANNLSEPVNDICEYLNFCIEKKPKLFNTKIPINKLRNEFLNEIISNDNISDKNHFYSITAPTGIGKTFGCLAFANKLKTQLSKNSGRIIYCLPFTSIIDQNYTEFEQIIKFHKKEKYKKRPNRYLLKHHYLTPKEIINRKADEKKQLKDYLDDQLLVESWQSSMIVTTFIQLFHTILGNRNRLLKKFHNIVNSIIILDEVQNIDPNYYKVIQKTFNILGKRFGMYFLLITATQPEIIKKEYLINLVKSDKYMKSDIFNRVSVHINKEKISFEKFINNFYKTFRGKSSLLVMNTKSYAKKIYEILNQEKDNSIFSEYKIYCLTTNLTPYDRKKQINEIKEYLKSNVKVIVVSTQLIEAGVDMSFETVYRDFGPLDSIIQVAGRCNRNNEYGKLGGKMYLVNLSNDGIYQKILSQYVKEILVINKYESKEFYKLSKDYYSRFNFISESNKLLNALKDLNYDTEIDDQTPISKFSLIEKQTKKTIFILRTKQAQKNMSNFISLNLKLKEKLSKEKKNSIRVKIEKLKYYLLDFQISLYENELVGYKDLIEPQNELDKNFPYQFISYENQLKYAYDNKTGFLAKPKKTIPCVVIV